MEAIPLSYTLDASGCPFRPAYFAHTILSRTTCRLTADMCVCVWEGGEGGIPAWIWSMETPKEMEEQRKESDLRGFTSLVPSLCLSPEGPCSFQGGLLLPRSLCLFGDTSRRSACPFGLGDRQSLPTAARGCGPPSTPLRPPCHKKSPSRTNLLCLCVAAFFC